VLIAEQSAVSTGHSMQTTEQSVHSKGCQVSGREQFLIGAECKGFGTGNSGEVEGKYMKRLELRRGKED